MSRTLDDYPPEINKDFCDDIKESPNNAYQKCMTCANATPGYTLQHPIPPDPEKEYEGITQAMCNDSENAENAKKCCFHDHFGPHTTK